MRLINFGVGEITDRLSILALKILHSKPGADVTHFTNERAALVAKLGSRNLGAGWFEQAAELCGVNGIIWRDEDELRAIRTGELLNTNPVSIAALAVHLQEMNDRRHQLIEQINKKSGEFYGNEKVTDPVDAAVLESLKA